MGHDLIVIGGGPAGVAASLQAKKRGLDVLLLEREAVGGQLLHAPSIENYPGFARISGAELSKLMEEQLIRSGVHVSIDEAVRIEDKDSLWGIIGREQSYEAQAIVVATGLSKGGLGIKNEEKFVGRGLSYCAVCDAPLFKGRRVAVIGSGLKARSESEFLKEYASEVFLVCEELGFTPPKGVKVVMGKPKELRGQRLLEGLLVETQRGNIFIEVEGVFAAEARVPASTLAKSSGIETDERDFIKVDAKQRTNLRGVFAAGDVTGGVCLLPVAIGEGCIAAESAYEFLKCSKRSS